MLSGTATAAAPVLCQHHYLTIHQPSIAAHQSINPHPIHQEPRPHSFPGRIRVLHYFARLHVHG